MDKEGKLINLSEEKNTQKEVQKKKIKDLTEDTDDNTPQEKSFRMISKIEPQKAKGRYNVFISDQFAFGVDEEVLIKFELRKGLHVTPELQKEIEQEDSYFKAYQKTLNYLSYSLRSEKQIRDYLKKNELEHFTDRMITQLKSLHFIDDLNYAQSYVRTMANINKKGPHNIQQELFRRGITEDKIMTALDEYPYELQLANAIELADKQWQKMKKHSEFESVQKVKKFLVNKGYSFEIAEEAISEINTQKDEEIEYKALITQAEKAERRYSRKYEGYELSQRLKSYLYSKAFPAELINRYIDERERD